MTLIAAKRPFGLMDNSYQSAGEFEGLQQLVGLFYDAMASRADAQKIHMMHTDPDPVRRDKLARFLAGWLGGPRLFSETYGPINIPQVHAHLVIDEAERDAWLACMSAALEQMPYEADFKDYLLAQLRVPAERIRQTARKAHA